VIAVLLIVASTPPADARITLRPHAQWDELFFHAHYSQTSFDPASEFTLAIWNCATGVSPSFLPGPVPIVVCIDSGGADYTLADLAYTVSVPAGSCIDHGRSCYYRARDFDRTKGGVRTFRVRYANRHRGNRVWLESYGDLSAATQASMLLQISIDGVPRAALEETFVPLPGGGWFSEF
jgi:hypothetical protein